MKALNEYFLMVVFALLLDRVNVVVNFIFNLDRETRWQWKGSKNTIDLQVTCAHADTCTGEKKRQAYNLTKIVGNKPLNSDNCRLHWLLFLLTHTCSLLGNPQPTSWIYTDEHPLDWWQCWYKDIWEDQQGGQDDMVWQCTTPSTRTKRFNQSINQLIVLII